MIDTVPQPVRPHKARPTLLTDPATSQARSSAGVKKRTAGKPNCGGASDATAANQHVKYARNVMPSQSGQEPVN